MYHISTADVSIIYIYTICSSSIHQLYSARLSLSIYIYVYIFYILYYVSSIYQLYSAIFCIYINTIFYILYVYIYTHRIHGAAIYGVPWIPSIYPSHVRPPSWSFPCCWPRAWLKPWACQARHRK